MQNDGPTHRHGVGFFRWTMLALVALLVVGVFVAPFLWGGYYGMMAPGAVYPHPFFGWFFWPFGAFFFIFIIFFAFRWLWFPWGRGYYGGRWQRWGGPEEIIKRRYARGEITKDQFDQMMRDLQQHE